MELLYSIVALWMAGWILGITNLWWPSMVLLGKIDPSNVNYRWKWLGGFIFGGISLPVVPITMFAVLSNKYKEMFIRAYVGSFLERAEDRKTQSQNDERE